MKLFNRKKKNNKGFSLVELIVVVAIMAVLVGVLTPTLIKQVEKSKHQKDISAVAEIANCMTIALADEKYASMTCTITYTGATVTIGSGTVTELAPEGTSTSDFLGVVAENLGKTAYTYKSKLADGDTETTFVIANGHVTTSVESTEYNTETVD